MGKYRVDKNTMIDLQGLHIKFSIANELAEANRLKIVELKLRIQELDYCVSSKDHKDLNLVIMAEEMDDQA